MRYNRPRRSDDIPMGKCFGCGGTPTAMWQGEAKIDACALCAVSILPKLIADAVGIPVTAGGTHGYHRALIEITAAFWEAVASRIAVEKRQLQNKIDGKDELGVPLDVG